MTFLSDLRRELAARGIRGRLAGRIEAELADHLECDPHAPLGQPAEIADQFAAELRIVRTRRASIETFVALALTAALLVVAAGRHHPAGLWPALAVLAGGQVAFVAGCLALLRSLRSRTVGDLRVVQRRAAVALAAGLAVSVAVAAQGPPWAVACGLAAAAALLAAAAATRRAARLTPPADAEGLSADFGRHATLVLAALGALAVAGIVLQGIVFEGSGWEGVIRGAIEAGGLAAGVAVLGRPLALRA